MVPITTATAERIKVLSSDQLGDVIARCEDAISEGTADVSDYEAFVLAQQELARRNWC